MSHKYYKPSKSRLQRSELAVPGSSPQMFEKALNSNADYIFLDLEDAVSPNDKIAARANVIKALNEIDWNGKGKTISVRINSLDTHYMYSDIIEIVEKAGDKLDTVLVPKAGTASDGLSKLVMTCRAYGLRAIDGPFGDFNDPDAYILSAKRAAAIGIEGKWAIHPSQIDLANKVFSPPETEVTKAKRILEELDKAAKEGKGAAQLDGRMIDAASARMAENIVNIDKLINK